MLLTPVGSPTFLLTKNSWLSVREYSPSTVPTRFHGSWRSKASDARSGCGNLRSLASRFTSPIGLVPCRCAQVAIGVGSIWNAGAGDELPLVLQFRKVMMLPELT